MKISHEIPKQLFPIHDIVSDYPYILAHLMSLKLDSYDPIYTVFYADKISKSEFSIFDNGCYELGKSIDIEILYELGEKYKPSHIVLPDSYGNYQETRNLVEEYLHAFGDISTPKFMAVLQGQTIDEYMDCYNFYNTFKEIDMIGITFREVEGMKRKDFLDLLFKIESPQQKIHLLGCSNPGEFLLYDEWIKDKIHSVDTSSPIIHGWLGNKFEKGGYAGDKPKIKLADNLDIQLDDTQLQNIYHNVKQFRSYIH